MLQMTNISSPSIVQFYFKKSHYKLIKSKLKVMLQYPVIYKSNIL